MRDRVPGLAAVATLVLLAAAGTAVPAAAAPTTPPTQRYIVETDAAGVTKGVTADVREAGGTVENVYSEALAGFSATLSASQVRELRADDRVRSVTPDGRVHSTASQTRPTWGLDRIDQRSATGNGSYRYDTTGAGVTAFVVDTGVRLGHSQFAGRAVSGYDFVDDDSNAADCEGHGTHVAGTIGGSTYGVAKGVKVVALRVLDCGGGGDYSDVIDALDWVIDHKPKGRSVVNLSLGGDTYPLLDAAVSRTVAAGIPVVVAAGNDGIDACEQSPARVPAAITVAATDAWDERPWWSNGGRCVDLFAPGVDVVSASNDSNSATEEMSGTSMASPHVAGVVARYLQGHPKATPAQTASALSAAATRGAVVDRMGAPDRLLYSTLPAATKPGAPTGVKVTKNDAKHQGTITFAPPTNNGGTTITGYRITRNGKDSAGAGPKTVTVSASTRSYTFTKLRAGAWYTLSVSAVNSVGTGTAASKTLTMAW
jgi:subtilisin family serine protease